MPRHDFSFAAFPAPDSPAADSDGLGEGLLRHVPVYSVLFDDFSRIHAAIVAIFAKKVSVKKKSS